MRRLWDSRASLAHRFAEIPIQKQATQVKKKRSFNGTGRPKGRSILIQEFNAGFVGPDPADFAMKAQLLAFHLENDFLVVLQALCLGRNTAASCTDVFNDAGLVRILKFQDSRPLATLAREDPGLLQ